MRRQLTTPPPCGECGKQMPYEALPGASCPRCINARNLRYKAQRLAGALPPKGFSV